MCARLASALEEPTTVESSLVESDTPRTDEQIWTTQDHHKFCDVVDKEFAQQLERELAVSLENQLIAAEENKKLRNLLQELIHGNSRMTKENIDKYSRLTK